MNNKKVLSGFAWRFAERCGAQGVGFIVSICLARLLNPSDYGMIAIVSVFTTILNVFVDSGMGSALVQKKDADDLDFSSVFYFNILFCLVLYMGLFFAAPAIALFYKSPELTALIRVMGLTLIISGVKNVQQAYVSKTMQFKRFFFATLGGTVFAACLGITLAYRGFGVWALVLQSLANSTIDTIVLWITVKWKPKAMFSLNRLKNLLYYGWKMLASSLLDTVYNNIRQLIIGVVYSEEDLAFYNKGEHFPNLVIKNINTSIDSVLLPAMSAEQDKTTRVKNMVRKSIMVSTYIMAPMMMGMCFVGESMIRLVLTEKWMPCVPYLRIFCITFIFYPIHTANLNAIKAMGRSDLFLKLEVIKKIVGLAALAITVPISVMAMGYSLLFTSLASQIINSWPNRKMLNYSYLEQLKDILPGILLAVAMGCCVYPIQWLDIPDIVTLIIQVPLGVAIYIGGSIVLKLESFQYLWGIVGPFVMKLLHRK